MDRFLADLALDPIRIELVDYHFCLFVTKNQRHHSESNLTTKKPVWGFIFSERKLGLLKCVIVTFNFKF